MFQYKLYEKWYSTNNNSVTINKGKNLKTKQKTKNDTNNSVTINKGKIYNHNKKA